MFQITNFGNTSSGQNINNNNIANSNSNNMINNDSIPQNTYLENNQNLINSQGIENNNTIRQQQEEPKNYKSIIELQKEINHYKNKEMVYKLQLVEKQKKINELKEMKKYYEGIKKYHKENSLNLFRNDQLFNVNTQKLLLALKKIIEDKNSILISLEEELYSSSPQAMKFLTNQLKFLQKENIEIFSCVQGSNIENFKKENTNEKNQLNALLIKIAECQENINDLIKNMDEIGDTSSMLKRNFNDNDK